jgi:3-oxoacyl-[acyl-carrier protein] reductase
MVRRTIPQERMTGFLANIPVGQLGSPEFIADIVARLCARDAGFVTGATWDINGGLYMR